MFPAPADLATYRVAADELAHGLGGRLSACPVAAAPVAGLTALGGVYPFEANALSSYGQRIAIDDAYVAGKCFGPGGGEAEQDSCCCERGSQKGKEP